MLTSLIAWGSRLFGGSSIFKWAGLALAGLLLAGAVGWLFWAKADAEAELARTRLRLQVMQSAYDANQEALKELRDSVHAKDIALARRDRTIETINAQREAMRRRWQEAIRNDPDTRDWSGTRLPDSVRGLLQ